MAEAYRPKPSESSKAEKVSIEDEGYRRSQEEGARWAERVVFGEDLLGLHRALQQLNAAPPASKEFSADHRRGLEIERRMRARELTREFEEMLRDRKRLKIPASWYIHTGLEYSKDASVEALRFLGYQKSHTGRSGSSPDQEDDIEEVGGRLIDTILEGQNVPADVWVALIEGNEKAIIESEQWLARELPMAREAFVQELPGLLGAYGVELSRITLARLDGIAVKLVDGLRATLEDKGGMYDHERNTIYISQEHAGLQRHGNLEEVLEHEYLHALSGRLVFGAQTGRPGSRHEWQYGAGRVGVEFSMGVVSGEDDDNVNRFRWLNEAITEELTLQCLARQGIEPSYRAYTAERELLSYLCTSGQQPIPLGTFVKAYFEDYAPATSEGVKTIPAWRELWAAVENSFGKQYLVELDKNIKKHKANGVAKVLKDLRRKKPASA